MAIPKLAPDDADSETSTRNDDAPIATKLTILPTGWLDAAGSPPDGMPRIGRIIQLFGIAAYLAGAAALMMRSEGAISALLFMFCAAFVGSLVIKGSSSTKASGLLRLVPHGFEVATASVPLRVDRRDLDTAVAARLDRGAVVSLTRLGKPSLILEVSDIRDARRVVRHLRLRKSKAAGAARTAGPVETWFASRGVGRMGLWGLVFIATGPVFGLSVAVAEGLRLSHAAVVWTMLVSVIGFVGAARAAIRQATLLDVRADGLSLRSRGDPTFVSFADVSRIRGADSRNSHWKKQPIFRLVLSDGREITIATHDPEAYATQYARVADAWKRYRKRAAEPLTDVRLERAGRAPSAWVSSLRAIGAGANADMRTAAVPISRLLDIVEDPAASATLRASAAIALSQQATKRQRQRVRVAAADALSPKLRVALEHASDRRVADEELAEALIEVEANEAAERRSAAR